VADTASAHQSIRSWVVSNLRNQSKNPRYQAILDEIDNLNQQVCAIFDAAGDEDLPKEQYQQVITNNKKIEELEQEAKEILEREETRAAARARSERMQQPSNALPPPQRDDRKERTPEQRGAGDMVLADPAFKKWLEEHQMGGGFTSAKFGSSPRVVLPGGLKTLITGTSDSQAGALVQPQFYGFPVQGAYQRPLVVRDLLTTGSTTSDLVEFVLEGTPTNNAAPVAEATVTSGSSGATPESGISLDPEQAGVKTISHWIPATRRALADAPQLRMYIETFLRYGVDERLEDEIITGDGTGEHFRGVLNTPGTLSQAWTTDILTTTRKARTKVRVTGRAKPTAYVMHPNDWETIDLLQDNEGRYYYGGPSVLGSPRLWGLPVVESEAMPEGEGVVADWRRGVLLDREQVQILVSDSHSDFFTRNMIAILAELRAVFFIVRPAAFVEIDLTA
jgi:HK97 family phage major capsid protein